jgi:hypothetical protein
MNGIGGLDRLRKSPDCQKNIPQGLKPSSILQALLHDEVVPFQNREHFRSLSSRRGQNWIATN